MGIGWAGKKGNLKRHLIMTKSKPTSLTTKFKYCYRIPRSKNFQVAFKFKGKHLYVGTFDTLLKAAVAADYKRVELGLPKEKINFPDKFDVIRKAIQNETKVPSKDCVEPDVYATRPLPVDLSKTKIYFKPTGESKKRFKGGFPQKKSRNKIGYKGVYQRKQKNSVSGSYYIQVWKDGKSLYIKDNNYATLLDAAKAFDINVLRLTDRSKQYLNFPERYEDYMQEIRYGTWGTREQQHAGRVSENLKYTIAL